MRIRRGPESVRTVGGGGHRAQKGAVSAVLRQPSPPSQWVFSSPVVCETLHRDPSTVRGAVVRLRTRERSGFGLHFPRRRPDRRAAYPRERLLRVAYRPRPDHRRGVALAGLLRSAPLQGQSEQLGEMQRPAAGRLLNLLSAAESVGDNQRRLVRFAYAGQ